MRLEKKFDLHDFFDANFNELWGFIMSKVI